jgi:hypothetical protein
MTAVLSVFAHVGHWWTSILYLAPVAVVVGWLGIQSWLQRRRDRRRS